MIRLRVMIIGIIVIVLVAVLLLSFLPPRQTEHQAPEETVTGTGISIDMGVTYLPVTRGVASYYDLEVDSGALVTEIIPGSLAGRAGVHVGDVILSYNGVPLNKEVTLLSKMMSCPVGSRIKLLIYRNNNTELVEFDHVSR